MLLEGKTAAVTGVGPGLGREIALAFAREGADVVLVARRAEVIDDVAAAVEALGRKAVPVRADVTVAADCAAVAEAAQRELGGLQILVNSAFDGGNRKSLADSDLAEWRATMEVNFWGALTMTKACLPLLTANDDSRLIMINTQSTLWIKPGAGAYASSKAALASATKTLARELGPQGVRVNGIHPGFIYGPNVQQYFTALAERDGTTFDEQYDRVAAQTALGYLPPAAEIAKTVLYLASDLATPVTGQAIAVNAGHWI